MMRLSYFWLAREIAPHRAGKIVHRSPLPLADPGLMGESLDDAAAKMACIIGTDIGCVT
jgi:hypothetical protein